MKWLTTHISTNKKVFSHLNRELVEAIFRTWELNYYSSHLWYFNLIEPETHNHQTFLIAQIKPSCKINDIVCEYDNETYSLMHFNFGSGTSTIKQYPLTKTKNSISINNLTFSVNDDVIAFSFGDHEYKFKEIIRDTYTCNFENLYEWYNLNTKNQKHYLLAQNYMIRGPVVPWVWLQIYLEDGTYIKLFYATGQKKEIRINDEYFPINKIQIFNDYVFINVEHEGFFIHLDVILSSYIETKIQMPHVPLWIYGQARARVKSLTTNLPSLKGKQEGTGTIEITKGFTL
jgi:hypothetical protein